jgi:glycerol-3-phosphate acyltransferase PlsY
MNTTAAFVIVAAYLLGSLSGSLLLGRLRGVDIRTMGSGNAGGTNAFRTQGGKFAFGVAVIDIGKGALAGWLGLRFAEAGDVAWLPFAAVFAAMVGHIWPVWHGFRGGKGAATFAGGLAALWPIALPAVLGTWVLSVILSGYVGVSTVLAGWALAVFAWATEASPARLAFAIASAVLMTYTHRSNLARLKAGTESRFDKVRLLHRLLARRG